jgi:hypothetical protein
MMSTSLTQTMRRTSLLVAAFVGALAQPLTAQATIGASMTTSVGPFTKDPLGIQSFGQSFTVPNLSTRLQSFSLSFSNFFDGQNLRYDASLYAFDAANRRLTGSALWTSLNLTGSSNDFDFDLRTFTIGGLSLNAGGTYMFFVSTLARPGIPLDAANLIGANDVDGYTGGAFWVASTNDNANSFFQNNGFTTVAGVTDASFSATFLASQTVIPEPATLLLTATGLLILGTITYRSRSQR